MSDPPMPTEPPPEPPVAMETKAPQKPKRSPPLDSGRDDPNKKNGPSQSRPLPPRRGPAPPKPSRSPPTISRTNSSQSKLEEVEIKESKEISNKGRGKCCSLFISSINHFHLLYPFICLFNHFIISSSFHPSIL